MPVPYLLSAAHERVASVQRERSRARTFSRDASGEYQSRSGLRYPPVLRKYGLSYLKNDPAGFEHWDFVATSPGDLKTLTAAFGLTYFERGSLVAHTMRTVLIAPNGTVANMWDGSEWRQPELVEAIRHATPG